LHRQTKNKVSVKSVVRFFYSLNGVFAPKSPLDNPVIAEFYVSVMNNPYLDPENDRKNLRNDMVLFGADFKKATGMAKEMFNVN